MIKTTEAAQEAGKAHGSEVAEIFVSQVSANEVADTDEAYAAFLARRISVRVRELGAGGMPDHLVQVWMDVAVKAGVARLRELSHVLSQPKRNDH